MNRPYFLQIRESSLLVVCFSILAAMLVFFAPVTALAEHNEGEIEQFVRARIDISESMIDFFRKGGRPQFGPDGGPSMEELRRLEQKINDHISKILSKHNLTIDEYQSRKDEVFSDEAGVRDFLAAHRDLEQRYDALPQSSRRGRPRH